MKAEINYVFILMCHLIQINEQQYWLQLSSLLTTSPLDFFFHVSFFFSRHLSIIHDYFRYTGIFITMDCGSDPVPPHYWLFILLLIQDFKITIPLN